MTTIAWDGRYIAADSLQGSSDYNIQEPAMKLWRRDSLVYAITGYFAWFEAWIKWYEAGSDPTNIPICKDSDCGNFIVFKENRCFMFCNEFPYADEQFAPCAFGSGRKYALGVMHYGGSAKNAVEVCCKIDPGSGGPILVYDLFEFQKKADAA